MEIMVWPPGALSWNGRQVRCAIGKGGILENKTEGDGATPAGCFPLRRVFYRADRLPAPETGLSVRALTPEDGWCEDPDDPAYNRLVSLPFAAGHETLWREDGLYDVIVELGYNDDPVTPGRGSAIFMHVAQPGYDPTKGCIALELEALLDLLKGCGEGSVVTVSLEAP